MGKKVRQKSRVLAKEKGVTTHLPKKVVESSNQNVESIDEGVLVSKETNSCPHLVKGVNINILSSTIGSSGSIRCEPCRQGATDRRSGKGKGKHGKKKGGASLDSKSESKSIWVCLECGQYTCGGVGLPITPHCHVVGHARKNRHPLVVHFDKPQLCWCFPCNMLIQVDKIEKTDESSHLLSDVVKLLKGRSSEKSSVDIEDVSVDDDSVTSEIKSRALVTSDSYEQSGYVVRGMINLGNTCFFNSIMQNLLAMNRLRDSILQLDAPVGPLISSLKKLFTETNPESGLRNIINPRSFFGCVCSKSPQFRGYQQHDSHELLRCLLDGLSTEELAGRKQNGSPKRDGTSSNTLIDALFGGQISSTVRCIECGHFSTVYEPFLDLSLPVPTKKPPPRKAQQVPRTKKTKLPPKKGGKTRVKVNRDNDPLPVQNLSNQLSSQKSSCPDQPIISVTEEKGTCSGESTLLGSEEIHSVADKADLSSSDMVTAEESQHMQVLDNDAMKSRDDFTWLDYVEMETMIDECDFISQKEDALGVQDTESKDECLNEFHEQTNCESSGPICFLKEDQNLRPKFSSENGWEDEVPLQVQGSEVLLLPYKDESSSITEIIGGDGEASSSALGGGQEESEFEGFGDLFNETEVVAGPAPRPSSCSEVMEAGFTIGSNSESDPDEVDDTDSPVSIESCLAHFIKPELLSDENAWHCENCSKVLQRQKLEEKKQAKTVFDGNETGSHDGSLHAANTCSVTVRTFANGDIENDKNIESLVSNIKHGTKLENGQKLSLIVNERDIGAFEMEDTHNDESQSSGSHNACNGESCSHLASDSCVTGNIQRRDSLMLANDNNDLEEVDSKSVKVKRDATKRVFIYKAPPVLTIHLKRFSQDGRGRLSKLNGHVNFREAMDIRPYIDPRCSNEEKYEYHLVGVVEHSGTMRGGHYVAYVRGGRRNRGKGDKEDEGSTWYQASDAYVREVSLDEVLRCEAYILFYEKN